MSDEVETMFATFVPWHRKGVVVKEALNARQAIETAGLDWGVELLRLQAVKDDGSTIAVPDNFASVRDSDDKVLGVVGSVFRPWQNRDAFAWADNLLDQGLRYDAAGSLEGGKTVWLTAKLPTDILVAGTQRHDLYLLISTGHAGNRAIRADLTPIATICMNTLNLAMSRTQQSWSIRHSEGAEGKVAAAREALQLSFEYANEYQQAMDRLTDKSMDRDAFVQLVKGAFPNAKAAERGTLSEAQFAMVGVRDSSPVIPDELRDTAYGALMAITEYHDHHEEIVVRKADPEDARLERLWFGPTKKVADRAFAALNA